MPCGVSAAPFRAKTTPVRAAKAVLLRMKCAKNKKKTIVARKNRKNIWPNKKIVVPLHPQTEKRYKLVPWMSGLVNGLQNRLRRFESARHLHSNVWNLIKDGVPFFEERGLHLTIWKVGRVIDRAGLEIRYTPFGYRGFESLTFRQEKRKRESL